ncbi:MAG TPA: N-acetylmuramoyl-L-alanine amidase [Saliniramus sp.]|nr:N-acetylmuramoyl-L-alanine amidase [Saliniramus sp.]
MTAYHGEWRGIRVMAKLRSLSLGPLLPGLVIPVLLVIACFALPGAAQAADTIVAINVGVEHDERETRLVFTLNGPVTGQALHTGAPARVIIDLPEVNFQLPADQVQASGLISHLRYGLFAQDRSRVVIDLAEPALVASLSSREREADGAHFFTIALEPVEETRFADAVARDSRALAEASMRDDALAAQISELDERPVIVVDPGHGGVDPGAVAAGGVLEKDIVLAFSLRLSERLRESGRYQVVMTRDEDVFVTLGDRVRIAREAQADLFISIHADSISSAPQVRGLTVYTGSEQASDAESARLAERENRADAAAGVMQERLDTGVGDILMDLTRRETRGFSHGFARYLVDEMESVARLNRNPVRQAAFRVLRAPDVPSVLVELGYLSSRRDIALLRSEEWRGKTTRAMAEAIGTYFTVRFANRGLAPVSP